MPLKEQGVKGGSMPPMDVRIVTQTNNNPSPVHNLQLPAFPTSLLRVHAGAASSALAAGAITYAVTHMATQTAVTAVSSTVSLGGLVVSETTRLLFGDGVASHVSAAVNMATGVVSHTGAVTTQATSIAASTAAAAIVGGGYLVGSGLWAIWDSYMGSDSVTEDTMKEQTPLLVDDTEFVFVCSNPLPKQECPSYPPRDRPSDSVESPSAVVDPTQPQDTTVVPADTSSTNPDSLLQPDSSS